jgi:PAS domain S-box-containing protein
LPNILLVDDNLDDLYMIKRSLRQSFEDLSVTEASSAALLENAIFQGGFDLVITDYHLGFTDGIEVLNRVKTHHPDCPVVMFTLTGSEEIAVRAMKSGMEDYILKTPKHLAQLASTVTRALAHQNERKTLETTQVALRESEWRYRSMFYSNHALMLFIDPTSMDIVDANPAACEFYGYSLEEFSRLRLSEIHTLPPEVLLLDLQNAFTRDREFFQARHRLKNQEIRNVEVYSGPITVGGRSLLYSIVHDVTERYLAQAQLKLQAVVLESAANAIVIADKGGLIQWANPAFTTLTGYSLEESRDQKLDFLNSKHQAPSADNDLWNTVLNGQVWHGRLTNQRKDTSEYIEEMTITPVKNNQNQTIQFIAIKQDVTQAEEYQRELELIQKIAWRLRETDDIQQLTDKLLGEVLGSLQTDAGSIVLFDPENNKLMVSSSLGWLAQLPKVSDRPERSVATTAMQTKTSQLIPDLYNNPKILEASRALIPKNWAGATIPIQAGGEMLGVLNVAVQHPRVVSSREVVMLERATELAANTIRRLSLRKQVEDQLRQFSLLRDIDLAITNSLDLDSVLAYFLKECVTQLGVDAATVVLHRPESNQLEYIASNGFKHDPQGIKMQIGEGRPGRVALDRNIMHIKDFNQQNPNNESQPHWTDEGFISCWSIPLWSNHGLQGILELFSRTKTDFGNNWETFLQALSVQAAIAIENSRLYTDLQAASQELEYAYDATIEALSAAIDLRDHETEGHSQRVTLLTVEMAKELGLDTNATLQMRRGALLHDIGKLGIPDSVLLKPGKLDAAEWQLMKQHPVLAHEWLSKIPFLRPALEIPYSHHERFDGTGYPLGLKAQEIPLSARIFAIVDVYDALVSDRPYRKAWTPEKTLDYLLEFAGTHFDPEMIQVFLRIMRDSRIQAQLEHAV